MAKGITEIISDFTLEREKIYKQGKIEGAKDFAEWLQEKSVDNTIALNYGKFKDRNIDELISEWQKEVENDNR